MARVLPFTARRAAEPWLPAYLTAGKSFEQWRADWLQWAPLPVRHQTKARRRRVARLA